MELNKDDPIDYHEAIAADDDDEIETLKADKAKLENDLNVKTAELAIRNKQIAMLRSRMVMMAGKLSTITRLANAGLQDALTGGK